MATQSELSGPDLTQGVPATSLIDGGMISGHVGARDWDKRLANHLFSPIVSVSIF